MKPWLFHHLRLLGTVSALLMSLTGALLTASHAVALPSPLSDRWKVQSAVQAIHRNDLISLKRLLAEGLNPNSRDSDLSQDPLLLVALSEGRPQAVDLLLKSGANPNALDLNPAKHNTPQYLPLVVFQ